MQQDTSPDRSEFVILVVDDSAENRLLLSRILEKQGYHVVQCSNGKECVEYCEKTELPALILLDVMMPEMDGIAACKILRTTHAKEKLPIILVTAKAEAEDIAVGLKAGANDYITKPIDRIVLLARIENQLSVWSSRLALDRQKLKLEEALNIQRIMGDVLPEAVLIANPEGGIVYSNHGMRVLCHGQVPQNIVALFQELWDGELFEKLESYQNRISQNPDLVLSEEINFGSTRKCYIQLCSKPIKFGADHGSRLWLFNDVTHMRLLERKMKEHMRLETVSLFATGVAHNFNNIMGGIQGATEILQNIAKDNRVGQKCIGIIGKALEQGTRLTNKMATFKKERLIDAGDQEDLNQLIFQVVEIQKQLVGDRITFVLQLDPEAPLIAASSKNLIDILTNLLSNAVDSIPYAGSITIRSLVDPTSGMVAVDIIDSGHGMSEEVLEKAFEPFFSTKQIDHVNGMSMSGNGLGLWNVYNLTNMLGGQVQIKSQLGRGTSVTLRLPLAQALGDMHTEGPRVL